jgi:hypothetical protein
MNHPDAQVGADALEVMADIRAAVVDVHRRGDAVAGDGAIQAVVEGGKALVFVVAG